VSDTVRAILEVLIVVIVVFNIGHECVQARLYYIRTPLEQGASSLDKASFLLSLFVLFFLVLFRPLLSSPPSSDLSLSVHLRFPLHPYMTHHPVLCFVLTFRLPPLLTFPSPSSAFRARKAFVSTRRCLRALGRQLHMRNGSRK